MYYKELSHTIKVVIIPVILLLGSGWNIAVSFESIQLIVFYFFLRDVGIQLSGWPSKPLNTLNSLQLNTTLLPFKLLPLKFITIHYKWPLKKYMYTLKSQNISNLLIKSILFLDFQTANILLYYIMFFYKRNLFYFIILMHFLKCKTFCFMISTHSVMILLYKNRYYYFKIKWSCLLST